MYGENKVSKDKIIDVFTKLTNDDDKYIDELESEYSTPLITLVIKTSSIPTVIEIANLIKDKPDLYESCFYKSRDSNHPIDAAYSIHKDLYDVFLLIDKVYAREFNLLDTIYDTDNTLLNFLINEKKDDLIKMLTKFQVKENEFKYELLEKLIPQRYSVSSNKIFFNGQPISNDKFIQLIQTNHVFLEWWIEYLSNREGFFFECDPINSNNLDEPFEFELIKSKKLNKHMYVSDESPFSEYIKVTKIPKTRSFLNLKKDSTLLIPLPLKGVDKGVYSQLASFMSKGPMNQKIGFWIDVGKQIEKLISENPDENLYVSTHGLGVLYLHMRFDKNPKYYQGKFGN